MHFGIMMNFAGGYALNELEIGVRLASFVRVLTLRRALDYFSTTHACHKDWRYWIIHEWYWFDRRVDCPFENCMSDEICDCWYKRAYYVITKMEIMWSWLSNCNNISLFELIYAYWSHVKLKKIKSDYRFTVKYSLFYRY